VDAESVDRLISRLEEKLSELVFEDVEEAGHLRNRAENLASRIFGEDNPLVQEVLGIKFADDGSQLGYAFRMGTARLRRALEMMKDENALNVVAPMLPAGVPIASDPPANSVFVVHGHDLISRTAIENMLRKHGLDPIILDDKANLGATIIEKFEAYSRVRYAVAILSADDVGCAKADRNPKPRARQNVLFELGYFFARLGRSNVTALLTEDIEAPSDIHGVVWIKMDAGGQWETRLLRELSAAGMPVAL